MQGRDDLEEADGYGPIGWIAGVILSVAMILTMFLMPKGQF
ncbi:MAG: hypothetical protein ACO3P0_11535 [Quisquiliibacterium sp.]